MFRCCSLETSHPRLLSQSPKDCSIDSSFTHFPNTCCCCCFFFFFPDKHDFSEVCISQDASEFLEKRQVKHHLYLTAIPGRERIHSQCVFLPKCIWKGKDSVKFPLPLLPMLHRSGRSDLVKTCYPLPGLCQFPHNAVCRIPSKWGVPVGLILVTRNRKGGKVTLLTLHREFLAETLFSRAPRNWIRSSQVVKSSPLRGEGNGKPLQYSCLEKSMDRGAWWAAVHGVTWLSLCTQGWREMGW